MAGPKVRHDPNVDLEAIAAWKYVGYPGFSKFMASSNDCFALRKFGNLNVRVLLKLQNEIVRKERELQQMDQFTMDLPDTRGGCGSFRLDANTPRERLLDDIASLLKDYNERLMQFFQIQGRPSVSPDQTRNLRNWLLSHPNAIEDLEQEFLICEDDLVSLKAARRTHFGRWMESLGVSSITAFRQGPTSGNTTKYYDRNAWKSIGGLWLLFCMMVLLYGPLWAMPFARSSVMRLAVVSSFTAAFSLLLIIGTTLKAIHRSLAVAGYFALTILLLGLAPVWHSLPSSVTGVSVTYGSPTATQTIHVLAQSTVTVTLSTSFAAISSSTTPTSAISVSTSTISGTFTPASATGSTSTPKSTSGSHKLSSGAIAGIAIAVIAVIISLFLGVLYFWIRRRRIKHSMEAPGSVVESRSPREMQGSVPRKAASRTGRLIS